MAITDMGFEIQIDSRERNTHGHIGSKQMTQNVESETFFLKGRARHLSKKKANVEYSGERDWNSCSCTKYQHFLLLGKQHSLVSVR